LVLVALVAVQDKLAQMEELHNLDHFLYLEELVVVLALTLVIQVVLVVLEVLAEVAEEALENILVEVVAQAVQVALMALQDPQAVMLLVGISRM
jgi:hypothetical protein